MTSKMTVLLVGSTGHMGSRIASALVKKDIELRAMVSDRASANRQPG